MAEYSTLDPKKLIYVAGVEAVKEFNEGKRVRVAHSKVKLTVSPFLPPFVPVEILGADVSGLITEVSWSKSRSAPAGSFTVTMMNDKAKIKKIGLGYPLSSIWDKFGASLLDVFKPMSTAKLDIQGYHIMTGFVESVKKFTDGGGNEYVTVEYSELGELYNKSINDLYQQFSVDPKQRLVIGDPTKVLSNTKTSFAFQTLESSLLLLVKAFLSSTLNYGLSGAYPYLKLSDGQVLPFRFITSFAPLGCIASSSFLSNTPSDFCLTPEDFGQTFWDWVKKIAQDPWMECFTESGGRTVNTGRITNVGTSQSVGVNLLNSVQNFNLPKFNITPTLPGMSYLVVRSTPFDNPYTGYHPNQYVNYNFSNGVLDLILSGDFVMVTDYDVISKELGQSQENQYTAFKVDIARGNNLSSPSGVGTPKWSRGPLLPIMPGGQRTYGNRFFKSNFDITSSNPEGFISQVTDDATKKSINPKNPIFNVDVASSYLQAWMRNASKFREGSITTRMIPYARPGMIFLYVDPKNGKSDDQRENGMYYIDSMTGNWKYGESATTQFSLIRGTPLPFDATSLSLLLLDWELFYNPLQDFEG